MNIFVSSLPARAGEEDLRRLFGAHGKVASVSIFRKASRRVGLVRMPDPRQARAALAVARRLSGAYLMDVQDDYADCVR